MKIKIKKKKNYNILKLEKVVPHKPSLLEKKTTPPKFYNDGTLVRAMETAGQFVEDEKFERSFKRKWNWKTFIKRSNYRNSF